MAGHHPSQPPLPPLRLPSLLLLNPSSPLWFTPHPPTAPHTITQDALGPAASAHQLQLPPALYAAAQRQWLATTRRSPRTSRSSGFAADVGRVLQEQLRLKVQFEARTADGLFSADMTVMWGGRWVVFSGGGHVGWGRVRWEGWVTVGGGGEGGRVT